MTLEIVFAQRLRCQGQYWRQKKRNDDNKTNWNGQEKEKRIIELQRLTGLRDNTIGNAGATSIAEEVVKTNISRLNIELLTRSCKVWTCVTISASVLP
jgi:hypothetical protein